jgi:hypothetical protein
LQRENANGPKKRIDLPNVLVNLAKWSWLGPVLASSV